MSDTEKITIYADDFFEHKKVIEDVVLVIVFRLAKEWYAVDITKTIEVVKVSKIIVIPLAPSFIKGVVNLRGNILPVADLKNILGLGETIETIGKRIVVVENNNVQIGFLVDEVDEVVDILADKIDPILTTISLRKAEYLSGQTKVGDKILGILKVERFFGDWKT